MNFSFWPFLWFGLPGRLLNIPQQTDSGTWAIVVRRGEILLSSRRNSLERAPFKNDSKKFMLHDPFGYVPGKLKFLSLSLSLYVFRFFSMPWWLLAICFHVL